MSGMKPVRIALVTALLVALPAMASATSVQPSVSSCTAGKTVVRTNAVRVFQVRGQVFSCWRGDRRRLVIRELYYDSYSAPAVTGRWLAYGAEHSDQNDYNAQVSLFDLRNGRKTSVPANGRVVALVLKDNGSRAFVSRVGPQRDEVVVADRDGLRAVYSGPAVTRGSLKRTPSGISWSTQVGPGTARLR